jgi:phage head maturation protease
MSFGFITKRDLWRQEGDTQIRELHQVDLYDVSPVTYPAYKATEIALRSRDAARKASVGMPREIADYWLRLANMS